MILEKTLELLRDKYFSRVSELHFTDIRIGVNLTAVFLSDGSAGISSTFSNKNHSNRDKKGDSSFSPGNMTGEKFFSIFENDVDTPHAESLRIAALNAVCSSIVKKGGYNIIENRDPVDLLNPAEFKTITIVGAFQSYIRKLSQWPVKLQVLELDPGNLADEDKKYFVPANQCASALSHPQAVIITGFTLVNNTIEDLLNALNPLSKVIVVGPSANILPDVLFQHGVDMIGATRITDTALLAEMVSQGAKGFHLFKACARKYVISRK
jgi:uncharacterized protein